jgi:hypothetical protein
MAEHAAHDTSAIVRPQRILVVGANGNLGGEKLAQSYETGETIGIEFTAADIVPEPAFKPKFTGFKCYYNLKVEADRNKLFSSSRSLDQKFDLIYDASWPESHLFNLSNLESLCHSLLTTKPYVSVKHYHALEDLMTNDYREAVREKLLMHDHYANKPVFMALLNGLPEAHRMYGKFSRILIMITERRTVNDPHERSRRKALLGGMVPDLASHAVIMTQLLTRKGLKWSDDEGNFFKRLDRRIQPTTCVRTQMTGAALPQDIDTSCIIELKVTETLSEVQDDEHETPIGDPFPNTFYVLVVCGKGLQAVPGIERDLKGIELCFQGQGKSTGIVDLETNTPNEVLERAGIKLPNDVLRKHRGINYPILTVFDRWNEFASRGRLRFQLFQNPALIWENMKALDETVAVSKRGLLPAYRAKDEIQSFVNAHIGPSNGFHYFGTEGSGWPMKEPPVHLMRGDVPASAVH